MCQSLNNIVNHTINTWNGNNFPYKAIATKENDKTKLSIIKYLLNDLYGDINLNEAPTKEMCVVIGDCVSDCFKKLNIKILRND